MSTPADAADLAGAWDGCHGVRLAPEGLTEGYGSAVGDAVADVVLESGPVAVPDGRPVWALEGELSRGGKRVPYEQRLWRTDDGAFVVRAEGASLRVERSERIVVDASRESLVRQLVTTFGMPLVLHGAPVLILHGCAAVPPDDLGAVVVCGRSGTGKSSLLVGAIAAGWTAVSEDVCVVDLRGDRPVVWPGPPWVRRNEGGPDGAGVRFTTADKTAWDIAPWQARGPVPLGRVVFLDAPGGDEVASAPLVRPDAIGRLARSAIWLVEPERRAAATFDACVAVAGAAPASTLRIPRSDDWLDRAEPALRGPA